MVHNGIITNSRALRALLERKGYTFVSETDTESVAVLIQYIYDQQKLNGEVPFYPAHLCGCTMHPVTPTAREGEKEGLLYR